MRRALAIARLVESLSTARAGLASSGAANPTLDSLSAREAGCEPSQASVRPFTTSPISCYPVHIEDEIYCRQRQTIALGNRIPVFAPDTWVAPSAVVVGDVDLYDKVCSLNCKPAVSDCCGKAQKSSRIEELQAKQLPQSQIILVIVSQHQAPKLLYVGSSLMHFYHAGVYLVWNSAARRSQFHQSRCLVKYTGQDCHPCRQVIPCSL